MEKIKPLNLDSSQITLIIKTSKKNPLSVYNIDSKWLQDENIWITQKRSTAEKIPRWTKFKISSSGLVSYNIYLILQLMLENIQGHKQLVHLTGDDDKLDDIVFLH